jgi:protein TonB
MTTTKAPTRRKRARQPDAGSPTMRRYTLASMGVHVVFLSLLSFPLIQPQRPVMAEPIYEVALIDSPEPNYLPPKPVQAPKPKPKPEKPKPKPKPKQRDEVVVTKKAPPKPKDEVEPEPEEQVEAVKPINIPNAPVETPSTGIRVDQDDFKHNYYIELLRGILARAWDPPHGGQGLLQTSVHFVIKRDGTVLAPEVTGPSGWSLLDRSALSAVMTVGKLPPLPEAYSGDQLGLTVNFQRMGDEQ